MVCMVNHITYKLLDASMHEVRLYEGILIWNEDY